MSPLSKALVIFVTLLSVALVALVVPFVAKQQNNDALYKAEKADKEALQAELRLAKAEWSASNITYDDLLAVSRAKVDSLTTLNNSLAQKDRDNADAIAVLRQEKQNLSDAVELYAQSQRLLLDEANAKETQIAQLIQDQNDSSLKNAQLADRVAELSDEKRRLINDLKRFKEVYAALQGQTAALESENTNLKATLADLQEGDTEVLVVPTSTIEGAVVRTAQQGENILVQLNVGQRDHVKEGMEFTLARQGKFVGTVKIFSVEQTQSVGRLTTSAMAAEIGDLASIEGF